MYIFKTNIRRLINTHEDAKKLIIELFENDELLSPGHPAEETIMYGEEIDPIECKQYDLIMSICDRTFKKETDFYAFVDNLMDDIFFNQINLILMKKLLLLVAIASVACHKSVTPPAKPNPPSCTCTVQQPALETRTANQFSNN